VSKRARTSFRRAQLQAKRNVDAVRRKERELLLSSRSVDTEAQPPPRRKGQEKLTQEDLALNVAHDVTTALERTRDSLLGSLEQSHFARQTIEESTATLASLEESYTGLGDLLKSSRGLASQLLRSQKSDTWYLETAFYILVATIGWLVFRRIIYGPAWWLIWQPLRLIGWMILSVLTGVGIIGREKAVTTRAPVIPGLDAMGIPTREPGAPPASIVIGAKGGGWNRATDPPPLENRESVIERVGKMAEKAQEGFISGREELLEDLTNTKKRMMEVEPPSVTRDEL